MEDFYNTHVIKFSKREYLEQIKEGKLYFKEVQYFKNIEENNVGDSHEGTIRIDVKTVPKRGNIFDKILAEDTELNMCSRINKKISLFCCSILNEKVLLQIDKNKFKFKKEFVDEMTKWGNDIIVLNIFELCSKLYEICKELNIMFLCNIVDYNQAERIMDFNEATVKLRENPFDALFHKNKKYMWQNEFRIILFDEYNKLIDNDKDYFIIDIGELKSAQIISFMDLNDMIVDFRDNVKKN